MTTKMNEWGGIDLGVDRRQRLIADVIAEISTEDVGNYTTRLCGETLIYATKDAVGWTIYECKVNTVGHVDNDGNDQRITR